MGNRATWTPVAVDELIGRTIVAVDVEAGTLRLDDGRLVDVETAVDAHEVWMLEPAQSPTGDADGG